MFWPLLWHSKPNLGGCPGRANTRWQLPIRETFKTNQGKFFNLQSLWTHLTGKNQSKLNEFLKEGFNPQSELRLRFTGGNFIFRDLWSCRASEGSMKLYCSYYVLFSSLDNWMCCCPNSFWSTNTTGVNGSKLLARRTADRIGPADSVDDLAISNCKA